MKIMISVAHDGADDKGAVNKEFGLNEYEFSQKVSSACSAELNRLFDADVSYVYDIGQVYPHRDTKILKLKKDSPDLAIEIHLNASTDKAINYGSVFHWGTNQLTKNIASKIVDKFDALSSKGIIPHKFNKSVSLPSEGYDTKRFWFITKTCCLAMIIEPMFISNDGACLFLNKKNSHKIIGGSVASGIYEVLKNGIA